MKNPFRPSPALVLFFLSPAIAEMLSSSSPPVEFFNPFSLFFLTTLYGSGAILLRETIIRWKKGWPSLICMAAAYGIIEEGLMVKSFFDPGWMDIGALGSYGRAFGINWVWAVQLTIFHAVVSMLVPIALTELLFPAMKSDSWVSIKWQKILAVGFVLNVIFSFFAITPYRPPVMLYMFTVLVVIGLIFLARQMPVPANNTKNLKPRKWGIWFTLAFFLTTAEFLIPWIFPNTNIPAGLTCLLMAGLACFGTWIIYRWTLGSMQFTDKARLALCSGVLFFLILLSPIVELDKHRTDNSSGMILVGLSFLILLIFLHRKYRTG
jgi:hypothetical protein